MEKSPAEKEKLDRLTKFYESLENLSTIDLMVMHNQLESELIERGWHPDDFRLVDSEIYMLNSNLEKM